MYVMKPAPIVVLTALLIAPLATLADLENMNLTIYVPEDQIGLVEDGKIVLDDGIGRGAIVARIEAAGNDRILVTGSFYVVGPVLERLYSRPQS